jgi:hypothetical protein
MNYIGLKACGRLAKARRVDCRRLAKARRADCRRLAKARWVDCGRLAKARRADCRRLAKARRADCRRHSNDNEPEEKKYMAARCLLIFQDGGKSGTGDCSSGKWYAECAVGKKRLPTTLT